METLGAACPGHTGAGSSETYGMILLSLNKLLVLFKEGEREARGIRRE
jgi:hypothetical protein